jgi:ATP-dependent Clp protease ATP-binding subunit ClpA
MLKQIQEKTVAECSKQGSTLPTLLTPSVFTYVALKEPRVVEFLEKYKTNVKSLEQDLKTHVENQAQITRVRVQVANVNELTITKTLQESLDIAEDMAKEDKTEATFAHFVKACYHIHDTTGENGEILEKLLNAKFDFNAFLNEEAQTNGEAVIDQLCTNLNEEAKSGRIDNLIGREDEVLRVCEVMGKYKKNNIVLLGKAGVGKTAIAEGLALKIVRGEVPETLKNAVVYLLDVSSIVAGTKFRGEFEEKMQQLIASFEALTEKGIHPILFLDEIHTIMGAGASGGGGLDFGNILKPALAKGKMSCIGATTEEEWQKTIKQDKALRRRFGVLVIEEPSREDTILILKGSRSYYEKKHNMTISDEAIVRCVDLADEYIKDSARPDKCLDLLDYTGSMMRIKGVADLQGSHAEEGLNRLTKVPLNSIRENMEKKEKQATQPLAPRILESLFGQDEAVTKVTQALEMSLAGIKEDNKTLGSFLLLGPTGTGKTELAKLVAKTLGEGTHFERIDMSEFTEEHSVAKLIGAPPGYVGFDQGSRLSRVIQNNPRTVLLLDEIEKAHPKVHTIFLQAMDNAKITDSQGEEVDFRNVTIFMTSNAGAREIQKSSLGLGDGKDVQKSKNKSVIENMFSPEFRGRLDAIVHFNKLSTAVLGKIVVKAVKELEDTRAFKKNGITIDITEEAINLILIKDGDASLGARPIKTNVKEMVALPISKEILYGNLKDGANTKVTIKEKDGKLEFAFS